MPEVITEDGSIIKDDWVVVERPADGESLNLPDQPVLIPADLWLAGKAHYEGRKDVGVWLDSHQERTDLKEYQNASFRKLASDIFFKDKLDLDNRAPNPFKNN